MENYLIGVIVLLLMIMVVMCCYAVNRIGTWGAKVSGIESRKLELEEEVAKLTAINEEYNRIKTCSVYMEDNPDIFESLAKRLTPMDFIESMSSAGLIEGKHPYILVARSGINANFSNTKTHKLAVINGTFFENVMLEAKIQKDGWYIEFGFAHANEIVDKADDIGNNHGAYRLFTRGHSLRSSGSGAMVGAYPIVSQALHISIGTPVLVSLRDELLRTLKEFNQ
ncbi:hypothetical protein SM033_00091 [Vibrio phage vB_VpaM_sm033]|nr:hypothetical protein SM033_00091 [Vibrio phage vB_VpaM_sm033]